MSKLFLVIIIGFFLSLSIKVSADVFFCSEKDSVGFAPNNYGKYTRGLFKESKFKAKIDFTNKTFISNDIPLIDYNCTNLSTNGMTCNQLGFLITVNKNDYKFVLTRGYGYVLGKKDTISVSIGTCDKF